MRNPFIFSLFLLMLFVANPSLAQQSEDGLNRELGLRFSGFDDFNLMYKKQLDSGRYRRHRILLGILAYNSNNSDFDINFGYAFGSEKRKPITEKLSFISGPDFLVSFAYSNSDGSATARNSQFILGPAIGYILGFQLDLSSSFSISAELIPSIKGNFALYNYSDNQYKVTAELNSNGTALSLMYKF